MSYSIEFYSDVGGRENNEDSVIVSESQNGLLLIVADGLGGHDCGEVASSTVVKSISEAFQTEGFDLQQEIVLANRKIMEMQENSGKKMKTTITAAWINGDETFVANVGDSRTYALKNQEIVFQSLDHSSAQLAVSVGEITADEIRNHPDRSMLTRSIGSHESVKVDIDCINTEDFDSMLLCSDGFWEYILEEEIIKCRKKSKTADKWIRRMRKILAKRTPSDNDNNTAIAIISTRRKKK